MCTATSTSTDGCSFLSALIQTDAVVLAGDLLHGAADHLSIEEAQRREADQLIGILCELGLPVLYVMGNDDMIELTTRTT